MKTGYELLFSDCIEDNIDYIGEDLPGISYAVVGQETCEVNCRSDSRCQFWTWHSETRTCYLKEKIEKRVPNPLTISGLPNCLGKNQFSKMFLIFSQNLS